MICKNCKEYIQAYKSDYCPHCGTRNWGIDKNAFISFIIAIVIFTLIYFLNSGNL